MITSFLLYSWYLPKLLLNNLPWFFFFFIINLMQWSQDTIPFYSKLQVFMLQHLLSFLPDLFRIVPGTASVGRHTTCLGLSGPPAALVTATVGRSLVGRHQVDLLIPWEAAEKSSTPQLLLKKGLWISRVVCALYFICYLYNSLLCLLCSCVVRSIVGFYLTLGYLDTYRKYSARQIKWLLMYFMDKFSLYF
jgi:hypothetical protein